jgi:hypothetical protein
MKRVLVERRIVALCAEHADKALDLGVETIDELRAAFGEHPGKRSLVDRRSPLDRRIFPARPEGRRRSLGRRATDP